MATFKSQPNSISYSKDNKWNPSKTFNLDPEVSSIVIMFFLASKNRLLTYYAVITIVQFED